MCRCLRGAPSHNVQARVKAHDSTITNTVNVTATPDGGGTPVPLIDTVVATVTTS